MPCLFRRLSPTVLVALLAAAIGGCATGGRQTAQRTGLLIEPGAANRIGYVINWARNLALSGDSKLAFVRRLGDVIITVERPSHVVSAVSIRNGDLLWRQVVGPSTAGLYAPARHKDQILVNTDTRLYVLRARDGEIEHIYNLAHVVAHGPAVVGSRAFFGSINGIVFTQDLTPGNAYWSPYKLTGAMAARPIKVQKSEIFAADINGVYAALNAQNGALRWRGHTFGGVVARPAVGRGIYVPSRDRSLYALDPASGRDQWVHHATQPLTAPAVPIGSLVLLPLPGRGLLALDAVSSNVQWRLGQAARPITQRGEQAVLARPRKLLVVDLQSGRISAQAPTLHLKRVLPGPHDSLILISPRGRLLRINRTR